MPFATWCHDNQIPVGVYAVHLLTADNARIDTGIAALAGIVPQHYADEAKMARILQRLGKPGAAKFIQDRLPTTKSIRSGDLGEILATEYIAELTEYDVPIKRLRWRDHRDMAMRGDDVIGMYQDEASGQLRFLKTEAKSRAALTTAVVEEARDALNKDGGLPSAHALSFVSSRLAETGNTALADAIDDAQLKLGIPANSVKHLLFVLSGNDPSGFLSASLTANASPMAQLAVGVRVAAHVAFVGAVYDLVIANANEH